MDGIEIPHDPGRQVWRRLQDVLHRLAEFARTPLGREVTAALSLFAIGYPIVELVRLASIGIISLAVPLYGLLGAGCFSLALSVNGARTQLRVPGTARG
jgi:hypothetical protein